MKQELRTELYFYLRQRLLQTWVSYVMLTGFFMLGVDFIRNNTQSCEFYFSVISTLSLVMSLVELLFFRKVIAVDKLKKDSILSRMQMLHFNEVEGVLGRRMFIVEGKRFFTRANEMTMKEQSDFLLININIFHRRFFKQFSV